MLKYSELREKIGIQPLLDEDNSQAYVTHYLYNRDNGSAHYFEEPAFEYFSKLSEHSSLLTKKKLSFKWDIPFPSPDKPKFKFIDLFAGIGGLRLAYQKEGGK
jgi:DNA (cytosine-5)-methyltransferase 1